MASYYEKYLDRIIAERKQTPNADAAAKQVQMLAPQMQGIRRDIVSSLNKDNASSLAKARFALDNEGRIIDQVGNIYSQAEINEIARQQQLQGEQNKAELLVDQEKAAKKAAEKARTKNTWKTAAEIAGTALGTAVTGGNIAAGLAIGKAAGGGVDMVTGLDKSYESPESIVEGGASILSGIITGVDTISQENFVDKSKGILNKLNTLDSNQYQLMLMEYKQALTGNVALRNEFISKWAR